MGSRKTKTKFKLNEVTKVTSIKEMLELAVKEDGDKIAFKYKGKDDRIVQITYKKFIEDINELGTALASIEMHNKHIATIGENSYKWLTTYLTVLQSTGVFVPVDKELTVKEIINVLKHSDSEVMFYAKKYEKWIPQIKEEVPNVKFFIGLDKEENDENTLSYKEFKANGKRVLEQGSKIYTDLKDDENKLKLLVYTSGTTGKFPNPSEVAVCDSLHGEWKELGNPHIGNHKNTSFDSQISCVFKVQGTDKFIAMADRWLMDLPEDMPDILDIFECMFDPDKENKYEGFDVNSLTVKNTSIARYVWLPVEFEDGKPILKWVDEFTV